MVSATGPSTIFFSTGVPFGLRGNSTSALPGTPFGKDDTGATIAAPPLSWMAAPPPLGAGRGEPLGRFDMVGVSVAWNRCSSAGRDPARVRHDQILLRGE